MPRYDTYHDPATAAIARRTRQQTRRSRITQGLLGLCVGGLIAAGTIIAKDGAPGRFFTQEPACAAPVETAQTAPMDFIAIDQYTGADIARGDVLAQRLETLGYTVDRQESARTAPVGPPLPQMRLLIHTPQYEQERHLLATLAKDPTLLPGDGVANLIPGRRLEDGSYRFFALDDHLARLVDRYVQDTPTVRKDRARSTLLRYLHPIIRQESGYQHQAVSTKEAIGLMQVTIDTAETVDNERDHASEFRAFRDRDSGYDRGAFTRADRERLLKVPLANLDDGIAILWRNYARCGGDMTCTLASYNAGPGNAHRWERIPETRGYVRNIHAMAARDDLPTRRSR